MLASETIATHRGDGDLESDRVCEDDHIAELDQEIPRASEHAREGIRLSDELSSASWHQFIVPLGKRVRVPTRGRCESRVVECRSLTRETTRADCVHFIISVAVGGSNGCLWDSPLS
jgi:hypothetical protein